MLIAMPVGPSVMKPMVARSPPVSGLISTSRLTPPEIAVP
jgi:hypothetical protein